MRSVTFTMDDALIDKLDTLSRLQRRSREHLLADLVTAYVERQPLDWETPDAPEENTLMALVQRIHAKIAPESFADLPTDLAMNYEHYLYGHPKEE